MSHPHALRPKEGASPRSTRQLLDELDALMDQMLALPVEEGPPDKSPPAPALTATLTMIEPEATTESPPAPSFEIPAPPSEAPPADESPTDPAPWSLIGDAPPTEIAASQNEERFALIDEEPPNETAPLAAKPKRASPQRRAPARPMPPSSASWTTNNLVVFDRGFRRMTRRLGVVGWLLRSAGGRVLLGMLGLALWIISLGWLVRDWLHWTR
jgi:hypothetical protein